MGSHSQGGLHCLLIEVEYSGNMDALHSHSLLNEYVKRYFQNDIEQFFIALPLNDQDAARLYLEIFSKQL
jgi:hypothetical protein